MMQKVNKRKVIMVSVILWAIMVITLNSGSFFSENTKMHKRFSVILNKEKEENFQDCLKQHNIKYWELRSNVREKCDRQVEATCKGSWWCTKDSLYNDCIHLSVPECRHIFVMSKLPTLKDDIGYFLKKGVFYLTSRYSRPFWWMFFLIFAVPAIVYYGVRAAPKVWKWFCTE